MTLGLMILSKDGFYLSTDNKLPLRPAWDKKLLLDICRDKRVICSKATAMDLPPSLYRVATSVTNDVIDNEFDINLGVSTFKDYPVDLLLVTRSKSIFTAGKAFNLEDYICILKQGDLELWTSIKKY